MLPRRPRGSIPTRIFLGFLAVLLLFGGVTTVSLLQHQRNAVTLRLLNQGYLPLSLAISESRATQGAFSSMVDRMMEQRDTVATQGWLQVARRLRPALLQRASDAAQRAERLARDARDRRTLARIQNDLQAVQLEYELANEEMEQLFRSIDSRDPEGGAAALASVRSRELRAQRALTRAWSAVRERIGATSAAARQQEQRWVGLLAGLGLVALALGISIAWGAQRLLAPLARLQERVAAVARGDLSARFDKQRDDEIGQVGEEFERMVDTLAMRDNRLRETGEAVGRLQRLQEQIIADLRPAVILVNHEGRIRSANRAAGELLSLGTEQLLCPLDSTHCGADLEGLLKAVDEVRQGAERRELSTAQLANSERIFHVLITSFREEEGQRAALVVAEDISEELASRDRRIHTERLAAIGRLAAHVTHEIRNPLSAIGLNVELLEEDMAGAAPEAVGILRSVGREVERLKDISEQYLRLARLPRPALEPGNITSIIQELNGFLGPELAKHGVQLELALAKLLPEVAIDEAQLRQALLNLIRNAREAMPEGGLIRLSLQDTGTGIEICLDDSGAGIPPEQRENVFDLFFTTKEHGTGLGLPLTQQIILAHGGDIECRASAGGGTCFRIYLPSVRTSKTSETESLEHPRVSSLPAPATIALQKDTPLEEEDHA